MEHLGCAKPCAFGFSSARFEQVRQGNGVNAGVPLPATGSVNEASDGLARWGRPLTGFLDGLRQARTAEAPGPARESGSQLGTDSWCLGKADGRTPCEAAGRTRAHAGSVQAVEAVVTGESLLPAGRKCPVGGVRPVSGSAGVCAAPEPSTSRDLSRQLEGAVRRDPSCECAVSGSWAAPQLLGAVSPGAGWRAASGCGRHLNTSRPRSGTSRLRLWQLLPQPGADQETLAE